MQKKLFLFALALFFVNGARASNFEIVRSPDSQAFTLVGAARIANVAVAENDYDAVKLAAQLFTEDVERVTGMRPAVVAQPKAPAVIVGTLGRSALIDTLARAGKLEDLDKIQGKWEATLWQMVDHPYPGIDRALVIVGSDRRGAAYGLMELSREIGVSPWYWWADAPVPHANQLALKLPTPKWEAPAVKYRGIFINDEDWGLNPWAAKTFDPQLGNIGPKTYAKVFELMLRLRLNYLWPAMHACSAEFDSQPDNIKLADRFGIVMGASHCEPMLCNNVHWNEAARGKWDYSVNRDTIFSYWENEAKTRGNEEAVWTLGIRGIHDQAMQGPKDIPTRIDIVSQVLKDQRELLSKHVTKEWGPVAQCFVPYKEVLPIYDAGLKVPDDVTLVWVDDNFGYIRRLSAPSERKRSGGAGVYWHLSYYGSPHSYTWINSTAPGLLWEEFRKAWDNDARTLWIINVGDIKPMEIGIDYFAKLAWSVDTFGPDSQVRDLHEFAAETFGRKFAEPVTGLLNDYYRLGTIRKPELMDRPWALSLTTAEASQLEQAYQQLAERASQLEASLPNSARDAFVETVGFPARVLGDTGLIFLADRKIQRGVDVAKNEARIEQLRAELERQVGRFNTQLANGKWNHMMPGLVTGEKLTAWSSQVRWPWGEPAALPTGTAPTPQNSDAEAESRHWRPAASIDHEAAGKMARWTTVTGLGTSGQALALEPAGIESSWAPDDSTAPAVSYHFNSAAKSSVAWIDFLPTFRLYPGMKERVAVVIDELPPQIIEVPGSSGAEDERGQVRSTAVQNNYVRVRVPLASLSEGKHVLTIRAIDPGVVIDRVAFDE